MAAPGTPREEVWLTKRARALLDEARGLVPVSGVKDSALLESALEAYVKGLRSRRA